MITTTIILSKIHYSLVLWMQIGCYTDIHAVENGELSVFIQIHGHDTMLELKWTIYSRRKSAQNCESVLTTDKNSDISESKNIWDIHDLHEIERKKHFKRIFDHFFPIFLTQNVSIWNSFWFRKKKVLSKLLSVDNTVAKGPTVRCMLCVECDVFRLSVEICMLLELQSQYPAPTKVVDNKRL